MRVRNINNEEETIILFKHKILKFSKPISALETEPRMGADELKSYFDSSPNELKTSLNTLIDDLASKEGAKEIGFASTNRVPANTVQDAIENVQLQLNSIALGSVPDGSITKGKLASDVLAQFTDIQSNLTTTANSINEVSSALSASDNAINSNLQNQINVHSNAINNINSTLSIKSEVVFGRYHGNSKETQFINLGFTPKVAILMTESGLVGSNNSYQGGLALLNAPCIKYGGYKIFEIVQNGLLCYQNGNQCISCNSEYSYYNYVAFK